MMIQKNKKENYIIQYLIRNIFEYLKINLTTLFPISKEFALNI
jgi:hypothetical protein